MRRILGGVVIIMGHGSRFIHGYRGLPFSREEKKARGKWVKGRQVELSRCPVGPRAISHVVGSLLVPG